MHDSQQISLLKRSILWLCVLIAIVGITYYYQQNLFKSAFNAITASTAKKELPIYNVQTDKKQVALSFDAAWGNEDTKHILDTLKLM
jgi:peptidoglycan/xylan/chitin deacetylase (PgdA/CDA1 family)